MVSQIAEAPNQKKGNSLDNLAYDNLKKLCPDIAKLKEGEFLILKTKSKTALDVSIGCKHPEKGEFSGIYEIYSIHQDTKVFTTVDISHKNKTAFAIRLDVS